MRVRAARGAIVVGADTSEQRARMRPQRLLSAMLDRNAVETGDLISILFTATDDLISVFPAEAARRMGMGAVPLMCAREIPVVGAMASVVRVLMHFHYRPNPRRGAARVPGRRGVLRDDLDH